MKFLMLVCVNEQAVFTDEDYATIAKVTDEWVSEMDGRGARLTGNRVEPVSAGAVVRVRGGERAVTAVPFVPGEEQIAGFDLLECADLDEAVDVAARHSMAAYGSIVVRPFWQD